MDPHKTSLFASLVLPGAAQREPESPTLDSVSEVSDASKAATSVLWELNSPKGSAQLEASRRIIWSVGGYLEVL